MQTHEHHFAGFGSSGLYQASKPNRAPMITPPPACGESRMTSHNIPESGANGQHEGQQAKELTEKERGGVESQILPPDVSLYLLKRRTAKNSCNLI